MIAIQKSDMMSYAKELTSSFAIKRELYSEYLSEQNKRGFDFTKQQYVKEKFPRFPNRIKKIIVENI